jgi:hypothetical protein
MTNLSIATSLAYVVPWSDFGLTLELLGGPLALMALAVIVYRFSLAARGRVSLGKQDVQWVVGLLMCIVAVVAGLLLSYYGK